MRIRCPCSIPDIFKGFYSPFLQVASQTERTVDLRDTIRHPGSSSGGQHHGNPPGMHRPSTMPYAYAGGTRQMQQILGSHWQNAKVLDCGSV